MALAFMDFGEECETNGRQCNGNKFLECIDAKCLCRNPLSHAFDEEFQQCVGLSSSPCGTGKPSCVTNSQCLYGACQCSQGFGTTSTNVCMKNHLQSCGPNECNGDKRLACIKGTCQCVDSTLVFDPFSQKCLNPQTEFDKFAKTVGRDVVQRVVARTVSDATGLVFLPLRLLVPVLG